MDGKILFSDYKQNSKPLYTRFEAESALIKAAIRMGSRKEFLEKLGGIKYASAEYGLVRQFTIPLDQDVRTLLLVSERSRNGRTRRRYDTAIDDIMAILKRHESK
jgi:hypothetical protein